MRARSAKMTRPGFIVVASEDRRFKRHNTEQEAIQEAERLANSFGSSKIGEGSRHIGIGYFVLKPVYVACSIKMPVVRLPIQVKDCLPEEGTGFGTDTISFQVEESDAEK